MIRMDRRCARSGFKLHEALDEVDGFLPVGKIQFFVRLYVADGAAIPGLIEGGVRMFFHDETDDEGFNRRREVGVHT